MPISQVSVYGSCWLGTYPAVAAAAAACVGNVFRPLPCPAGSPPLAKNAFPVLKLHPGMTPFDTSHVPPNSGGTVSRPKLSNRTSYAIPKPPRIDVLPDVPGEKAKPMRGAKFPYWGCGSPKVNTPGTL